MTTHLTQAELDALPLGARVGYTDARGCPGAAVKVGTRQSSGSETFSITGPTCVSAFAVSRRRAVLLAEVPGAPRADAERALTRAEAPEQMTTWWNESLWFPFVESEDCDITGPGHQDPETFAVLVNAYDTQASGGVIDRVDAAMVVHDWIRVLVNDVDEWVRSERVPQDHPDAIAVTTIWGVR